MITRKRPKGKTRFGSWRMQTKVHPERIRPGGESGAEGLATMPSQSVNVIVPKP
jgi:hypothetical protein